MKKLRGDGYNVIIFEPTVEDEYMKFKVINNLSIFKQKSEIVLANRMSPDLDDIKGKVYCRDIFNKD